MLDRAGLQHLTQRVYRVALSADRRTREARLREAVGDGPEFAEALDLLGGEAALDTPTLSQMLAYPFQRPAAGRYSDGSYGVLYTAKHDRTAKREYAHWAPQYYNPNPGAPYRVRMHLISCTFQGRCKDVRSFVDECPWLIANEYTECQNLGAQARREGLSGLLVPSARDRPNGTNIPVFVVSTISEARDEAEIIFAVTAGRATTYRTHRRH